MGSDVLLTLQQMRGEQMAERVATHRFDEAGACCSMLHGFLDQTWIQGMAALLSGGRVLPSVPLWQHPLPAPAAFGKAILSCQSMGQPHGSPARRQILLMEVRKAFSSALPISRG